MGRQVSFWMLILVAVIVGIMFVWVIKPFILPIMLACVVTMLARPYYEKTVNLLWKQRRLTALLFSLLFLFLILLPVIAVVVIAGNELLNLGQELMQPESMMNQSIHRLTHIIRSRITDTQWEQFKASSSQSTEAAIAAVYSRTQSIISNIVGLVTGLSIACMALYYFLWDGPQMVVTIRRLSPLESRDEDVLMADFAKTCRGVVLSTLACAFFQAVAAGIGFALVGVERLWLLSVLTMFSSMIPFVGAAAVWVPVCAGMFLAERWGAGIFLAVYCATVVSSMDNLLRAYVLGDTAKMHPLMALISILGAIQVVGLWGIVLGPVIASFFYAILKILRDRQWDSAARPTQAAQQPLC